MPPETACGSETAVHLRTPTCHSKAQARTPNFHSQLTSVSRSYDCYQLLVGCLQKEPHTSTMSTARHNKQSPDHQVNSRMHPSSASALYCTDVEPTKNDATYKESEDEARSKPRSLMSSRRVHQKESARNLPDGIRHALRLFQLNSVWICRDGNPPDTRRWNCYVVFSAMGCLYLAYSSKEGGEVYLGGKASQWVVVILIYILVANFAWSWAVIVKLFTCEPEIMPTRFRAKACCTLQQIRSILELTNCAINFTAAFTALLFSVLPRAVLRSASEKGQGSSQRKTAGAFFTVQPKDDKANQEKGKGEDAKGKDAKGKR
ncbi:hypothetical protein BU15DRAFT_59610 [Melanogaster broomeanus]|nr:hypothetical protein BU15DRAFT_59610 [Melanogaster broomeanus]